MKLRLKSSLWRRGVRTLGRLLFRWAENNDDERIEHNGERWLLRQALAAHTRADTGRPFVLFDVGANIGTYALLAVQEARRLGCGIEVHAFEPSPVAADRLQGLVGHESSIKVVRVALADRSGEAPLHAGGTGSGHASLVQRDASAAPATAAISVELQRLDDYMERNKIWRIDLLKLDVEGSERAVLLGLGERLEPHTVNIIQFEYGGTTRDAHVSLRDLERLVVTHGYAFAKLFPASLEVRAYREWMDNYSYANYVALTPPPALSSGP